MIRLLLVDDHPLIRRGLRMRLELEPDITVVGEGGDGTAALRLVRELGPDVVLMDVEMPGMDGITAAATLSTLSPHTPVVILSLHDDADTRRRAAIAGASLFVPKHKCGEELLAAIRQAAGRSGSGHLDKPLGPEVEDVDQPKDGGMDQPFV